MSEKNLLLISALQTPALSGVPLSQTAWVGWVTFSEKQGPDREGNNFF